MGSFGLIEWVLIILVLLLFFGAKRIPDMARGLAQGYVEFKKGRLGDEGEQNDKESDADSREESPEDRDRS